MRAQMGTQPSSELGSREVVEVEETVKTLLAFNEVHVTETDSPPSFMAEAPFEVLRSRTVFDVEPGCSSMWPERRQHKSGEHLSQAVLLVQRL